jgi:glycosyltransferase involved in cell wall biosynthesis
MSFSRVLPATSAAQIDPPPAPTTLAGRRPKLLFLVTEDWYFCSHRLPVARAARDAGFEVVVATRVRDHATVIQNEGFRLAPLAWRRRGDGAVGAFRALIAIARLYRTECPAIVHHVALKSVLFGGFAARLAFPHSASRPHQVAAVMGLGSRFGRGGVAGRLLEQALRLTAGNADIIVQNPEDGAALVRLGLDSRQIALVRGSGVDTAHFRLLPEPAGPSVEVALVARMLRSKGVLDAVAAVRQLRAAGRPIELLLAGPLDLDNLDSLDTAEMEKLSAEPGMTWLGAVADIRTVWARAAIAVFPSTYGEGVPKALLEAAACGRPIIAADMPGCREIVRQGETGLRVPPHDVVRLAEAIGALADDPAARRAMGQAGRALVERDFAELVIAEQTLALYRHILAGEGKRR